MADVHMEDAAPARGKPPAEAASAPAQPQPPAAKAAAAVPAAPPASSGAGGAAPMQEDDEEDEGDHAARAAELQRIDEELSKADDRCVAMSVVQVIMQNSRDAVACILHRQRSCFSGQGDTGAVAELGGLP